MLVRVAQLFVDGRPLPRHRSITTLPVHVGHLALTDQYDDRYGRKVTCAILRRGSAGADVVPRLCNAQVRWIGEECMSISGLERDEVTGRCSMQSWYVQLVTDHLDK